MDRKLVLISTALAFFTSACFISRSSLNTPLHAQKMEQLVPGQSTAREVTELLGAPNEVVQLGQRTAYRYDFTTKKTAGFTVIVLTLVNDDTRSDRIWLFFDAHDVLTHTGATFEGAEPEYAMPWDDSQQQ